MAQLSAEDVTNQKFKATRFREGYDQDEVDEFLEEVTGTLRTWESLSDALASGKSVDVRTAWSQGQVTSAMVTGSRFRATRRHEGYSQPEVDTFLDDLAETLYTWEKWAASNLSGDGGGAQAGAAAASGAAAVPGDGRDQYVARLEQENARLRNELAAARQRLAQAGL